MQHQGGRGRCPTLEGVAVWIDDFVCPLVPGTAEVFFLSHFHYDHYVGLSDSFSRGIIYCSEVTRKLLLHKFPHLSGIVEALAMGEERVISAKSWPRSPTETTVNITTCLIPANHCPGSCMLFLEGAPFGRVLHTGDFRLASGMCSELVSRVPFTTIFLDTTFCIQSWEAVTIPPKQMAITQIIALLEKETYANAYLECDILGIEELLFALHDQFHCKIHVSAKKYDQFAALSSHTPDQSGDAEQSDTEQSDTLDLCAILTKNETETWIHICKKGEVDERISLEDQNAVSTAPGKGPLFVKASTQWFHFCGSIRPQQYVTKPCKVGRVWHVLYCIHCSVPELESFLSQLSGCNATQTVTTIVPITQFDGACLNAIIERCGGNFRVLSKPTPCVTPLKSAKCLVPTKSNSPTDSSMHTTPQQNSKIITAKTTPPNQRILPLKHHKSCGSNKKKDLFPGKHTKRRRTTSLTTSDFNITAPTTPTTTTSSKSSAAKTDSPTSPSTSQTLSTNEREPVAVLELPTGVDTTCENSKSPESSDAEPEEIFSRMGRAMLFEHIMSAIDSDLHTS
ncbi:kinase domain protein [Pelomyxa schiedti]|nr:kinase domain protein [Pelomyxa schiedti]